MSPKKELEMNQVAITLNDLSTTARDLAPLLREFREPFDAGVRRLVDENWEEICAELALHDEWDDVVVMISDARESWPPRRLPYLMHSVVPRATAIGITLPLDVRVADWLAAGSRKSGLIDVVVESHGQLTTVRLEHTVRKRDEALPTLDETRSFTLWNIGRSQRARYVFLDTGDAVATWSMLAALLGIDELMLDAILERAATSDREDALAWTSLALRGDETVRCVRIDRVEPFLSEVERLAGGGR
ncbi:MAG: hypothetical protein ACXVEF_04765 [Polyangiales bacterium]